MPLLQVRDCPQDVYGSIALAAKRESRTIAQQTVVLLRLGLGHGVPNQDRRRALLSTLAERSIPAAAIAIDQVSLIREDRAR